MGGPPVDENEDLSRDVIRGPGGWTFMAPFELSFVLNFTVIDIFDINEEKAYLDISFLLKMRWYDDDLTFQFLKNSLGE